MKSNYDILGNHIRLIDTRNKENITDKVLGINIDKSFMPSVANVIGTNLSKYKLITKGKFACNPMHVGRDERLPVALYDEKEPAIVSPAYFMFEIIDKNVLDEDYLMMWFRRPEFDRICWFHTDGSVRGGITWDDICRLKLPIPSIEEQKKIIHNYNVITNRIELLKKINDNLEATLQAIFREFNNQECSTVPLNQFTNFQEGPGIRNWQFVDNGIKFVNIRCIQENDLILSFANQISVGEANGKYKHFMLNENDIIVSTSGTLGKNAIIRKEHLPLCLNTSIIRFTPVLESDYAYLLCLIRSKSFVDKMYSVATGSAQVNLGPMQLNKMELSLPSIEKRIQFSNIALPLIKIQLNNLSEINQLKLFAENILSMLSHY